MRTRRFKSNSMGPYSTKIYLRATPIGSVWWCRSSANGGSLRISKQQGIGHQICQATSSELCYYCSRTRSCCGALSLVVPTTLPVASKTVDCAWMAPRSRYLVEHGRCFRHFGNVWPKGCNLLRSLLQGVTPQGSKPYQLDLVVQCEAGCIGLLCTATTSNRHAPCMRRF